MFFTEFVDICKEFNDLTEEAKEVIYSYCFDSCIEEGYDDEVALLEVKAFIEGVIERAGEDMELEEQLYEFKKLITRILELIDLFEEG